MDELTGGCACGAVRYGTATPSLMMNCHCRDCQKASGAACAALVIVPRQSTTIRGELRFHEVQGESGHPVRRGFCPICGSQVAAEIGALPDVIAIQAGSLDDPSEYKPSMEIWTTSAQPWIQMLGETEKRPHGLR